MYDEREMTPDMKVFVLGGGGLGSTPILPQGVLDWAISQRSPQPPQMVAQDYPRTPGEIMKRVYGGMTQEAIDYWKKKLGGGQGGQEIQGQPGAMPSPTSEGAMDVMTSPTPTSVPQEQYGTGAVKNWQEREKIMQELKQMGI